MEKGGLNTRVHLGHRRCTVLKIRPSHHKQQTHLTLHGGRTRGSNLYPALFISVIGSFVFKWGSGQGSWRSALIFIAPSGAREGIG